MRFDLCPFWGQWSSTGKHDYFFSTSSSTSWPTYDSVLDGARSVHTHTHPF